MSNDIPSEPSREASPDTRRHRNFDGGGKQDKIDNARDVAPPALPPRPSSRPPLNRTPGGGCNCGMTADPRRQRDWSTPARCSVGFRKYVCLCVMCGTLCVLLGSVFLTIYFMLKTYTSSLNYFETIPTYVPSAMLMTTGFLVSSLGSRKNRSPFLMKVCGGCSMTCALVCLSVTVTTAVIHMNRLQTLRECYYTGKTRSCTCESILQDGELSQEDIAKFVFNSTSDCEVIHGVLYSCLRAVFGLSVVGILVCIFTCMLVYQLLSHEKKKMYWAQLELRCRYLYGQHGQPFCSCCEDCRFSATGPHDLFPWELVGNRFLAPGRIGNLYTPNPEDRNEQSRSGWSWRRLPWGRASANNTPNPTTQSNARPEIGSPDSQYGFTSNAADGTSDGAPYTIIDNRARPESAVLPQGEDYTEGGFYSWGPPPPYSSYPNSTTTSPARRSFSGMFGPSGPRRNIISPVRTNHSRSYRPPVTLERQQNYSSVGNKAAFPVQRHANRRSVGMTPNSATTGSSSGRSDSASFATQSQADQKQDNYENTREIELSCLSRSNTSTPGFNTLPSLKKRKETDVANLFSNKFSSSSLASVDHIGSEGSLGSQKYLGSSHGSNDSKFAHDSSSIESQSQRNGNRHKEDETETKNDDLYKNQQVVQYPKKKTARKLEYGHPGFSNYPEPRNRSEMEKVDMSRTAARRPMAKPPRSTPVTPERRDIKKCEKISQKLKSQAEAYIPSNHGSFANNVTIMKRRGASSEHLNPEDGVENLGFQHIENVEQNSYVRSEQFDLNSARFHRDQSNCKEGRLGECESDVYFGDVSNSSYMSIRSEMPENVYEEAGEPVKEQNSGQPLLNKTNLKIIEKECCKFDESNLEYQDVVANTSPCVSLESNVLDCSDNSLESFGSNRSGNYPSLSQESRGSSDSMPKNEEFSRFTRFSGEKVGVKKITAQHHLPNQFRPVRESFQTIASSNDDQSSSSLAADSGISSSRNYLPSAYYCEQSQPESLSTESDCSIDLTKVEVTPGFGAAILQKPKVQPRVNRAKDKCAPVTQLDSRISHYYVKKIIKNHSPQSSELANEDIPNPKPRAQGKLVDPSPKPMPRTTISKPRNFLAPDAQYELVPSTKQCAKLSPRSGLRSKPKIPARPFNLPPTVAEKTFTSIPSRRRIRGEESDGTYPASSHSVNV